ncbi:MAG: ROK family protein [Sediminibacterium magnilacihabitans]|jgi:predicted NBD/HSP70 family sugar kinase|nr:ROK family protein [Sediminibacterium magnilacihabitans]PQV61657.1 putative NBD/HSP70 family sugar kinase [Sediminibacterium magnilacihabitans]
MTTKKSRYRRQIIKELFFSRLLSGTELSAKIDKSIPLTNKLLSELVSEGVVVEDHLGVSSGGRRPIVYSITSDALYVVSVAMDQLFTKIAIMDMSHRFVTQVDKISLPLANNEQALSRLSEEIQKVIQASGIAPSKIAGIGIAMPGFVDAQKGINHTFLKGQEKSVTETIAEVTGCQVFIDNDSSLIALAEQRFGAHKYHDNTLVINLGWGVGLGMILNGRLFRGDNGFAGEFSHIPLFTNNKLCECGKTGCLETETSLLVILEKAIKGLEEGRVSMLENLSVDNPETGFEAIIKAANKGDAFATELLSEVGYSIGRGVAVLIHILNPKMVIISGRGANAGKVWEAPIQQALNVHCIPRLAQNVKLSISAMGANAELMGAASLVMDNYEVYN